MVAVKYIIPIAIREHKIICMSHSKKNSRDMWVPLNHPLVL